ncbi:MAG: glycosyltransferase family 2 protein [Candidatus Lokiarchaeota archaeon]|nr:glycosyltransferase family 2 protein [Candidatus Lokiarchaeota archaeon]
MIVSIIIITLNEIENIEETINKVRLAARFPSGKVLPIEIIVSDGGSTDGTIELAKNLVDKVIIGPKGRYLQLNTGAKQAKGDILLFLHADTILPKGAIIRIIYRLKNPNIIGGGFKKNWNWNPMIKRSSFLKFAAFWWQGLGNWLVRLLRTFPGDNAIFVRKSIYEELKGFRPLWICEDFDFSRRLKKYNKDRFICIHSAVLTSTRRYETYGFFYVIFFWFWIYWFWRLGMSQKQLEVKFKNVF